MICRIKLPEHLFTQQRSRSFFLGWEVSLEMFRVRSSARVRTQLFLLITVLQQTDMFCRLERSHEDRHRYIDIDASYGCMDSVQWFLGGTTLILGECFFPQHQHSSSSSWDVSKPCLASPSSQGLVSHHFLCNSPVSPSSMKAFDMS